ncbi:hypothetical protein F5148DRAFT_235761 [Russula earlei]|uniref:Uncharacterized protein n=1 Tax=Russula earlei TaxID=71964 RepID=A0ACC0U3V5_9AGAM|nr:hypothetical protein F5148DRAFT_235761 [Russula earlei]
MPNARFGPCVCDGGGSGRRSDVDGIEVIDIDVDVDVVRGGRDSRAGGTAEDTVGEAPPSAGGGRGVGAGAGTEWWIVVVVVVADERCPAGGRCPGFGVFVRLDVGFCVGPGPDAVSGRSAVGAERMGVGEGGAARFWERPALPLEERGGGERGRCVLWARVDTGERRGRRPGPVDGASTLASASDASARMSTSPASPSRSAAAAAPAAAACAVEPGCSNDDGSSIMGRLEKCTQPRRVLLPSRTRFVWSPSSSVALARNDDDRPLPFVKLEGDDKDEEVEEDGVRSRPFPFATSANSRARFIRFREFSSTRADARPSMSRNWDASAAGTGTGTGTARTPSAFWERLFCRKRAGRLRDRAEERVRAAGGRKGSEVVLEEGSADAGSSKSNLNGFGGAVLRVKRWIGGGVCVCATHEDEGRMMQP